MPEISVIYLLCEMQMVWGQNEMEVIKEVIVNFLHSLGPKNIIHIVFINIASGSEANMTTLCEMDFLNFKWLI